jgi:RND family efflux transporter MFP subunit
MRHVAHFLELCGYAVKLNVSELCGNYKYLIRGNMPTKYIYLVAAICLLSAGCSKTEQAEEKTAVEVKIEPIHKTELCAGQSFSGTVEESSASTLSFSVGGTVKSIAVSAGQHVAQGALIATLDASQVQSALDAASATLEQAQDAYSRLAKLHDNNSLPEIQWVEAESKLKQAQSTYNISKKNLNDTRLYAPFSGYIKEKNVEVGHNVMPGSPVVELVTVSNVKVCISVPETEISRIAVGNEVKIQVPALANQTFVGRINEKGVAANPISRSYEVKAVVNNPKSELLPGMLCTLYIDSTDAAEEAIVVPTNIVQLDSSNRNFVWVAVDGKAARRYVELGRFDGDKVVVASGLAEGDNLIVEGQQKVSDNMKISIKKQ